MLHKAERGLGRSDAAIHNGDWSVSRVPLDMRGIVVHQPRL
jgi:hypothetical protein